MLTRVEILRGGLEGPKPGNKVQRLGIVGVSVWSFVSWWFQGCKFRAAFLDLPVGSS